MQDYYVYIVASRMLLSLIKLTGDQDMETNQ